SARTRSTSPARTRWPERCAPRSFRPAGPVSPAWSRARAAAPWTASSPRCCRRPRPPEAPAMLLELARWLQGIDGAFGVFAYITLRAILSALTALVLSLLLGPPLIRRLTEYKIGQTVRSDGPQTHLGKAGTPTMGGALILFAVALTTIAW